MAKNIGIISAKVALDTVDFNKNIASMRRELKIAKGEADLTSKGVAGFGTSTKTTASMMDGLTKQINIQKQSLTELDRRYNAAAETHGRESRQAQNAAIAYNKTANEMAGLQSQYDQMHAQLKYEQSSLKKSGDSWTEIGNKASNAGDKMVKTGIAWTAAGAGVAAVTTLSAKAAIDYESAFAGVTKTVDGTAEELENLSQGIRKMATEIPVSATELSDLAAMAGQLGIAVPNIEGFTRVIADMGVATNLAGEEGAAQLAKFANITKMSQTDFDRLGSSIVDLGNHFSTTEADIMNMAMRLAGAGTQVGMSQADILGLSAALSSVGIEAEMGGSAISKTMVNMQVASATGLTKVQELEKATGMTRRELELLSSNSSKDFKAVADSLGMTSTEVNKIIKAGKDLEGFASIAGMTGEQFKQAFEKDAVGALGAFINGLANAESKGTTAIELLDELGISEVRLRDSLLRAGNASELFSNAVSMSNNAWEENVALTNEAETRYGTTASKIQIARNKINDLAITFGSELLPALADALESSGPLVEMLKDMIEGFADASPVTKKFVFALGALAIGGGPVLTTVGGLTKGFSTFAKWLGKSYDAAAKAKAGLDLVKTGATAANVAVGTSGLSGSTVGLTGFLGATGLAGTLLVVGAGLAGTALVAWGLSEAFEATQRAGGRWGTAVTKEQDEVLKKTEQLSIDAVANVDKFQAGVVGANDKVIASYQDMANEVEKSLNKQAEKQREAIEKLPEEMKKDAEEQQKINEENNKKIIDMAQQRVDRVQAIMQNAYENKRKLTANENAELMNLTKGLTKDQLEALNLSAEQQEAIMEKMASNIADMTPKQLNKYSKQMKEAIKEQNELYKEQVKNLESIYKDNPIKLQSELEHLEQKHKNTTDQMVANFYQAQVAAGTATEDIRVLLGGMGYSMDEVAEIVQRLGNSADEMSDKMAQGTEKADIAWNALILDPKTGEIKDNLSEFLAKTARTKEGWDSLLLIAKEATINSNAREMIAMAIGEAGKWNELSVDEKRLITNNDQALIAFYDTLTELNKWNEAIPVIQEIGANNSDAVLKIIESQETLNAWNNMNADLKQILVNNEDKSKIMESTRLMREWEELPDSLKNIIIKADTSGAYEAQQALNSVNDKNVRISVTYEGRNTGAYAIPTATGTNFHPGGLALVNDQKGSLYREFIQTPSGMSFIPDGRNVVLNLERGSKVMPAGMTKAVFPNYEKGIGFENGLIPFRIPEQLRERTEVVVVNNESQSDFKLSEMMENLMIMVEMMTKRPVQVAVNGKVIAEETFGDMSDMFSKQLEAQRTAQGMRRRIK